MGTFYPSEARGWRVAVQERDQRELRHDFDALRNIMRRDAMLATAWSAGGVRVTGETITNINASTITTGTLNVAAVIDNGAIAAAQIASIANTQITGEIITAQIADNAVTNTKISAVDEASINWVFGGGAPTSGITTYLSFTDGATTYKVQVEVDA